MSDLIIPPREKTAEKLTPDDQVISETFRKRSIAPAMNFISAVRAFIRRYSWHQLCDELCNLM